VVQLHLSSSVNANIQLITSQNGEFVSAEPLFELGLPASTPAIHLLRLSDETSLAMQSHVITLLESTGTFTEKTS
jgi:hypothetical protein